MASRWERITPSDRQALIGCGATLTAAFLAASVAIGVAIYNKSSPVAAPPSVVTNSTPAFRPTPPPHVIVPEEVPVSPTPRTTPDHKPVPTPTPPSSASAALTAVTPAPLPFRAPTPAIRDGATLRWEKIDDDLQSFYEHSASPEQYVASIAGSRVVWRGNVRDVGFVPLISNLMMLIAPEQDGVERSPTLLILDNPSQAAVDVCHRLEAGDLIEVTGTLASYIDSRSVVTGAAVNWVRGKPKSKATPNPRHRKP